MGDICNCSRKFSNEIYYNIPVNNLSGISEKVYKWMSVLLIEINRLQIRIRFTKPKDIESVPHSRIVYYTWVME